MGPECPLGIIRKTNHFRALHEIPLLLCRLLPGRVDEHIICLVPRRRRPPNVMGEEMKMATFGTHIGWPVTQNLLATIVGGVAVFLGGWLYTGMTGCPSSVRVDVARGERMLLEGEAGKALRVADDAVAEAPSCSCAREMRAKATYAIMKHELRVGSATKAEELRRACYADALRAGDLLGTPPVVETLRATCKAA